MDVKKFLFDASNIKNCKECPDNEGFSTYPGHRLPCGQFHCWVELHTKRNDDDDDDDDDDDEAN